MTTDLVAVERIDGVHIIRMNDPQTLNAASADMVEQLIAALADASGSARAVLLTGEGRGFCSGANLGKIPDPLAPGYDAGLLLETHYNPLMLAVRDLSVPIVTAVNGPAAGMGAALALAGDIIVAAKNSFFIQAFDRIGLASDSGAAYLLIRSVGRPRAMEMIFLGERISATQAFDWGLVNRLVEPDQLIDVSLDLARRLAAGPTRAYGMVRKIAWDSMESTFSESLAQERLLQSEAGRTADHREGLAAFFEKRPAAFKGK